MAVNFENKDSTFILRVDDSEFNSTLLKAKRNADDFAKFINSVVSNIRIATLTKDFIEAGNNFNAAMNQYQASFELLLGSVELANVLMDNLKEMANTSSFEVVGLAETTQMLLLCGVEGGSVVEILTQLGNVALGNQDRMYGLAEAFGQVTLNGRMMNEELVKMIENGFNPIQAMSSSTGISLEKLSDEMNQGKLSVERIANEFVIATKENGRFCSNVKKDSTGLDTNFINLKESIVSFGDSGPKMVASGISRLVIPALKEMVGENKELDNSIQIMTSTVNGLEIAFGIIKTMNAFKDTSKDALSFMDVLGGMNPAILATGAAVGIVVGLFSIWNDNMKNSEAHKYSEELEERRKKTEELEETTRKAVETGAGEIAYYQTLKRELDSIVDVNGRVKEGYESRAEFIAGRLSEVLGIEIGLQGNLIDSYAQVGQSIDEMLNKKRASTLLDANESSYQEALTNQQKYNKEYGELKLELTTYDEKFQEINEKYEDEGIHKSQAYHDEMNAIKIDDLAKKRDNLKSIEDQMIEANNTVDKHEKAMIAIQEGNSEQALAILNDSAIDMSRINEMNIGELKSAIDESEALQIANNAMFEETGDERYQVMAAGYKADKALLETQLKSQEEVILDGSAGYTLAWSLYTNSGLESILGKSKDFDDVGQKLIESLADGSEFKQLDANTSVQKVVGGMILTMGNQKMEFNEAGQLVANGIIEGVNSRQEQAHISMRELSNKLRSSFKQNMEIYSPSRVFVRLARWIPEGIAKGIHDSESVAVDAISDMTKHIVEPIENLNVGELFDDNLAFGLSATLAIDKQSIISDVSNDLMEMQKQVLNQLNMEMTLQTQAPIQNVVTYNFEQTIHNLKEKSASEIAMETQNLLKRARWNS